MSDLPPALAPWAPYLDCLPTELAVALGPLVRRVAAVLDASTAGTPPGDGEPDGFDGLDRRGDPTRLLLSEWLLAEEAPDEFVRRAAMNELAFLRPRRRAPVTSRRCVALFDTGPEQVGAPRLAHLAVAVVLARRADAAGSALAWGAIARPELPLVDGFTRDTVRAFLERRTLSPAHPDHADTWIARCGDGDEVWWIGSPRLAALPGVRRASLLTVATDDDPDARTLTVQIAGRAPAILPLPPDPLCTRLLRDPFAQQRAASRPAALDVDPRLIFAPGGRKLWARSPDHRSLVAFPIPNSPRDAAGAPRRYEGRPGEILLAADNARRSLVLCFLDRDRLRVHTPGKPTDPPVDGAYRLDPTLAHRLADAAASGLRRCLVPRAVEDPGKDGPRLWIEIDDREWIRVELAGGWASLLPSAPGFAARRQSDTGTILHFRDEDGVTVSDRAALDPPSGTPYPVRAAALHVGFDPGWYLTAVRAADDDTWHIVAGDDTHTVRYNGDVVGVCATPDGIDDPAALVTVSPAGRMLCLRGPSSVRTLPGFGGRIVSATVSNDAPLLAVALDTAEIVVWDIARGEARCRIALEKPA